MNESVYQLNSSEPSKDLNKSQSVERHQERDLKQTYGAKQGTIVNKNVASSSQHNSQKNQTLVSSKNTKSAHEESFSSGGNPY